MKLKKFWSVGGCAGAPPPSNPPLLRLHDEELDDQMWPPDRTSAATLH